MKGTGDKKKHNPGLGLAYVLAGGNNSGEKKVDGGRAASVRRKEKDPEPKEKKNSAHGLPKGSPTIVLAMLDRS